MWPHLCTGLPITNNHHHHAASLRDNPFLPLVLALADCLHNLKSAAKKCISMQEENIGTIMKVFLNNVRWQVVWVSDSLASLRIHKPLQGSYEARPWVSLVNQWYLHWASNRTVIWTIYCMSTRGKKILCIFFKNSQEFSVGPLRLLKINPSPKEKGRILVVHH